MSIRICRIYEQYPVSLTNNQADNLKLAICWGIQALEEKKWKREARSAEQAYEKVKEILTGSYW